MKVYFDSLTKKVYSSFSFAEGAISLIALIGVVVITVLAIISIRPRGVGSNLDSVSVSDGSSDLVSIENILSDDFLEYNYQEEAGQVDYTIKTKTLEKGQNEFTLMSIDNSGEIYGLVNFSMNLKGYAQDILDVELIYVGDSHKLFENGESTLVELGAPPKSQEDLKLVINTSERVNFPIEIQIHGDIITI